jgi:hypothetical protein
MDDEYKARLAGIFREKGIEKVMTCPQAMEISKEYDIPLADIGKYCNTSQVKIRGCQLGCFR